MLVTPVPPDPGGAGAIPVLLHAELVGLRRVHEVTLVTAVADEEGEANAVARLRQEGDVHVVDRRRPPPGRRRLRRQAHMALTWARGRFPWRTVWFADPGFQHLLDQLGAEHRFDIVAVEDSAMSVFRYPAGVPLVYTHHEVLRGRPVDWHPGPPRAWPGWAFRELDWRRWPRFQRDAWRRFDRIQVFSRRDAETLVELDPEVSGRVRVNPFGIELPPVADAAAEQDGLVLFVGNFAHPPNRDAATWLAREIMPVVRARVPTARLRIVGTAPPPVVRALADEHTELVADAPDVLPHLAAAAVVAAPVRTGGGMRMKVLQAMAAGRAVVTTRRGTEGFSGFDDPPPLSVAEDAVDIAATIATLLEDEEGRRSLACRAREFCVAHYSPDAWAERLSAVYEEAAGG